MFRTFAACASSCIDAAAAPTAAAAWCTTAAGDGAVAGMLPVADRGETAGGGDGCDLGGLASPATARTIFSTYPAGTLSVRRVLRRRSHAASSYSAKSFTSSYPSEASFVSRCSSLISSKNAVSSAGAKMSDPWAMVHEDARVGGTDSERTLCRAAEGAGGAKGDYKKP